MKKLKLILILLLFYQIQVYACLCERVWFCDFMNDSNTNHIFWGRVVEKKIYAEDNHAMYIKVLEKIRGTDLTDTVKIYGVDWSTWCEESIGSYNIGGEYIFSFNDSLSNMFLPIENPDSLIENFIEYHPYTCLRHQLLVKTNGMVRGFIKEDLIEYPLDCFLINVDDCNFMEENIEELQCEDDSYVIFPNPFKARISVKTNYYNQTISSIKFYNANGHLIRAIKNYSQDVGEIDLGFLPRGIYVIEVNINQKTFWEKIVKSN